MKTKQIITVIAVAGTMFTACNNGKTIPTAKIESNIDSVSYLIGYDNGKSFNENIGSFPGGLNTDAFAEGFITGMYGDSTKVSVDDIRAFVNAYFMAAQQKEGESAKQAGIDFLVENAKKEGVTTTASGLQYEVMTEGTGAKPVATDKVKVHYHGTLLDGTVFDSSVDRGEPAEFGVTQVIPGWTEALQLMTVGSKYKVFIPSELGYGEKGAGQSIKPNSTLIFEVELLDIIK